MKNLDEQGLLRSLTLKDAVGIGLGAIIGAGIFSAVVGVFTNNNQHQFHP